MNAVRPTDAALPTASRARQVGSDKCQSDQCRRISLACGSDRTSTLPALLAQTQGRDVEPCKGRPLCARCGAHRPHEHQERTCELRTRAVRRAPASRALLGSRQRGSTRAAVCAHREGLHSSGCKARFKRLPAHLSSARSVSVHGCIWSARPRAAGGSSSWLLNSDRQDRRCLPMQPCPACHCCEHH